MTLDIAVVPSAPALLPEYAGQQDPLPEVREAALAAVRRVARGSHVAVLTSPDPADLPADRVGGLGERVARGLLAQAGFAGGVAVLGPGDAVPEGAGLLVVADGSARRGEKAPGHLDKRALGFDEAIGDALRTGDASALTGLDEWLAEELLAAGVPALRRLGKLLDGHEIVSAEVDYSGDPYGVSYWVVRWSCES